MQKTLKYFLYIIIFAFYSCQNRSESLLAIKNYRSNFKATATEWTFGYSNLKPPTPATDTSFKIERTFLPSGLDTTVYSIKWSSRNIQANTVSYIKSEISGLNPNHTYEVNLDLEFATAYPESSSAGNKVYLKAGGTPFEPMTNMTTGMVNFDKGEPSKDGTNLFILGNISKGTNRSGYSLVQYNNEAQRFSVQANATGKAWLCIAMDSEYTGISQIYITQINATLIER